MDPATATREYIDLATAAIAFESARLIAAKLKDRRDSIECDAVTDYPAEFERQGGFESGGIFDIPTPHWKQYGSSDDEGRANRLDEAEWCASCRRRQRHHEAFRAAMKVRGARMRSFQRLAKRGIDLQAIEKEVIAMADDTIGTPEPEVEKAPESEAAPTEATEEAGSKLE